MEPHRFGGHRAANRHNARQLLDGSREARKDVGQDSMPHSVNEGDGDTSARAQHPPGKRLIDPRSQQAVTRT